MSTVTTTTIDGELFVSLKDTVMFIEQSADSWEKHDHKPDPSVDRAEALRRAYTRGEIGARRDLAKRLREILPR